MASHLVLFLCVLGPVVAQDFFEKQTKFLAQHSLVTQAAPNQNVTKLPPGSAHSWYITIRPSEDANLCVDLPGGDVFNGNLLWLWECGDLNGQLWVFDNWQIRYGPDENYCLDAGDMSNGRQLWLWECNGLSQQTWDFDEAIGRVYLDHTSTCLDAYDPAYSGQPLHVWDCMDGFSNQEWSLSDASDPKPPRENIFPTDHCQYDTGVWPSFQTVQDLVNDPYWSVYFTRIYGGVPTTGYPICPGAFQYLWRISAAQTGVVQFEPQECATGPALPGGDDMTGQELPPGTFYSGMTKAIEAWTVAGYIYNPNLYGVSVPANTWVEVSHTVFPGDKGAIWYYMSVGSGVWVNTGNTAVYRDHPDVTSDLLGQSCDDQPQNKWGTHPTECENNFDGWYSQAQSRGLNTLQVTHHFDCTCGPAGESSYKHYRHCLSEIIALDDPNGAASGCSKLLKGGWEASGECKCDESFKSDAFDPKCKNGIGCSYANCGAS